MECLNDQEIRDHLAQINSVWMVKEEFLHCELLFKDFVNAFSFMTAVALVAEKSGHHPNWTNTYNKVSIDLNTHDAGGITTKDFDLAKVIDNHYKKYL